jgi:NADPH:quinone reductase-like Zn-dependent oxidoreductase
MKAVVCPQYGPPGVLKLVDVEKPTPKANELLVKVYATTVNRTDCGILRAKPFIARLFYGLRKPKHPILGNEFAGEVEAVGQDVTAFQVGVRVVGVNTTTFGAHAQYLVIPAHWMVTSLPGNLGYEEAAPTGEGAGYALKDLRAGNVTRGQRVLINGATGAIGSASVQLAKHFGADVTAVCDTKHIDLVRSLGADHIIDYTKEDFTKRDQTYDFIHDAVGKSSFRKCKALLKPGGIYCSSDGGFLGQNLFWALWTSRFGNKKAIFALPKIRQADMVFLRELIEAGEFKPVIDRRYSLEQILETFTYVERGHKTGNVVITVDHHDEP